VARGLADLAQRVDPLVAPATIGITHDAALHYMIGTVNAEAAAFTPTPPGGLASSAKH
jgi:hypothetical protein